MTPSDAPYAVGLRNGDVEVVWTVERVEAAMFRRLHAADQLTVTADSEESVPERGTA